MPSLDKYKRYAEGVISGDIVACGHVKAACERYLSLFDRYAFSAEACDKVVRFIGKLRHVTGKHAGKPFVLEEWQKFIIYSIYGFRRDDGTRLVRNAWIEVSRKAGKALAVDTPIPTPTGYKTMGELKVGDTVFDENGDPTKVTFATPVMYGHKCYEVTFSDGEVITADADHNWYVDSHRKRKYKVLTTQEIVDMGYYATRKNGYKDYYFSVPTAKPLDYEERELPCDPYTFGVWLGDGTKNRPVMSLNGDDCDEIMSYIPYKGRAKKYDNGSNCYEVTYANKKGEPVSEFSRFLIDSGLKGEKRIPDDFLYNSKENRLALLQGLMDTDGYVNVNPINGSVTCEITQKDDNIAAGICFLLNSFGVKYNDRMKTPTLNGKKCHPVHRISFNVDKSLPVFRLRRKYDLLSDKKAKKDVKHIVSIKETDSVPVRCITVDSPNHLYLCGRRNTVTHNTALVAALTLYHLIADGEANAQVILSATSARQASLCFTMAKDFLKPLDPEQKLFKYRRDTIRFGLTKSQLEVVAADASRLDGKNASAFVCDEVHEFPDGSVFNVLQSSTGMRSQPLGICITTAGFRLSGWAYDYRATMLDLIHGTKEDDATFAVVYTLDSEEEAEMSDRWIKSNPNLGVTVTEQFITEQLRQAKNNPALMRNYLTKIQNMWVSSRETWIDDKYVRSAQKKWDEGSHRGDVVYLGLDLSAVSDMTAVTMLIPVDEGATFKARTWYFLPREQLTVSENRERYKEAARHGELIITQGNVVDIDYIVSHIMAINEEYTCAAVGYDTWNSTATAVKLEEQGVNMLPYSMSISSVNRPTRELERLMLSGKMQLWPNSLDRWCFNNVQLKTDYNGNSRPVKASAPQKIDGVMSLVVAIGAYLTTTHTTDAAFIIE